MPIVTDQGFQPNAVADSHFATPDAIESGGGDAPYAVRLANDADPRSLAPYFGATDLIVVEFPKFDDGRGFSVARNLRALGYAGRLRAKGHIIADQYPMARACGFDEVEIDDLLAARQPEAHWLAAKSAASATSGHALRARR